MSDIEKFRSLQVGIEILVYASFAVGLFQFVTNLQYILAYHYNWKRQSFLAPKLKAAITMKNLYDAQIAANTKTNLELGISRKRRREEGTLTPSMLSNQSFEMSITQSTLFTSKGSLIRKFQK